MNRSCRTRSGRSSPDGSSPSPIETITLPRGESLDAEIVRHPGSVVIIPVTDSGEIVLVRQYRHAIGRWAWELPAEA